MVVCYFGISRMNYSAHASEHTAQLHILVHTYSAGNKTGVLTLH